MIRDVTGLGDLPPLPPQEISDLALTALRAVHNAYRHYTEGSLTLAKYAELQQIDEQDVASASPGTYIVALAYVGQMLLTQLALEMGLEDHVEQLVATLRLHLLSPDNEAPPTAG